MSGYTTSGATILRDIESLDHGLLMWRSETHFIGGMGFLTLTMIFLPHGMSGANLFRSESSPDKSSPGSVFFKKPGCDDLVMDSLHDHQRDQYPSASTWGMNWFDSICHAFSTVATAGFRQKMPAWPIMETPISTGSRSFS